MTAIIVTTRSFHTQENIKAAVFLEDLITAFDLFLMTIICIDSAYLTY